MLFDQEFTKWDPTRGFVSDRSRKDVSKVVAKRLDAEPKATTYDDFDVGRRVVIKQKTKERNGTIIKVNFKMPSLKMKRKVRSGTCLSPCWSSDLRLHLLRIIYEQGWPGVDMLRKCNYRNSSMANCTLH